MRRIQYEKPAPVRSRAPNSIEGWNVLLREAITRAERQKDRRLEGFKRAMIEGKAEPILRRLGIICPADLDRELPLSG